MRSAYRPLTFGISIVPSAEGWEQSAALVELADRSGLELVGIQDHPYQRRFLDTFELLAVLAARTERIRLFPDVANLPLRPPAMLAKASASLDVLSGGRFELGLGAGSFWDAVEAMGGPRRSGMESVDAFIEAIEILRRCWSGERSIDFEGEHYRLAGHHPGPPPQHPIEIWAGAYGPRMLRVTGRLADGWVPSHSFMSPEAFAEAGARIDEAAEKSGRDPAAIRRLYNISGTITDGATEGELTGPPEHWVQTLGDWSREIGVDTFVFWPEPATAEQVERFATEVAPALR